MVASTRAPAATRAWLTLSDRAYTLCRDRLGEDDPRTLRAANDLAFDLRQLGECEQARILNEDTLTRYRRVLGDHDPYSPTSANNLGLDLHQLGEYDQARTLNEDTLARYRRVLGEDNQ